VPVHRPVDRNAALVAVLLGSPATLVLVALFASGGVGLHAPDIEAWLEGEDSAFESPPLAAAIRSGAAPDAECACRVSPPGAAG